MKCTFLVAFISSLAVGVNGFSPKGVQAGKLSTSSKTSFNDIVPLPEGEGDPSRRLFLTTAVALGLVAGIEPVQAAESVLIDGAPKLSASSSSTITSDAAAATAPVDWKAITQKASKRALGGGKAGASAAVVQVCSLMWLRTSMNYQVSRK